MSTPSSAIERPTLTLRTFLRRGWSGLILGIVIGVGLGYVVANAQTPSYESVATVYVTDTGVGGTGQVANGRTSQTVNLDTEANLVTSTRVRTRSGLVNSKNSLADILGRISVTVPPNSALMNIAYTTASKLDAQKGALAVAKAYLADRTSTAKDLLAAQIKQIKANITSTTASLKSTTNSAAKYKSDSAEGIFYGQQINLLNKQISNFNLSLATAQATVVRAGSISGDPTLPTQAAGPAKILFLASGLGLGVLLGLFLAWLLARRPARRLRRPDDVQRAIGLPVIARIGELEYGQIAPASAPAAEAYRRLINVVNATVASGGRIVLVTGSDNSEMASTVTHNMAATLARSGERVAVLKTVATAGEPVRREGDAAYQILAGSGPRTRKAVQALRDDRDTFVLIDTPEPLKTADAQSYGATADAVVIVLRDGTSTAHAQRILAEFDAVSAPVLGVVLVQIGRAGKMIGKAIAARDESNAGAEQARTTDGEADAVSTDAVSTDAVSADAPADLPADNEHDAAFVTSHPSRPGVTSSPGGRRALRNVDRMRARANRD